MLTSEVCIYEIPDENEPIKGFISILYPQAPVTDSSGDIL